MKNTTDKNVNFNKSGTGGVTPRVNLEMEWLDDMKISKQDKTVTLQYDEKKKEIKITKK